MELEVILAAVGVVIVIGYLAEVFFSKTRIPDVIWLIGLGILIGPVFGVVKPLDVEGAAEFFTAFALLFILFEGGLHIRINDLMKSMYGATTITIVNFIVSVIVIAAIARFFGWGWENAFLLGTMLGGTSSAVVVPIVRKLKMSTNNSLILILESAFTDVISIVAALTLINIINLGTVTLGSVLNSLFGSFAIAIFLGGIIGFIWILLLEKFEALTRSYFLTIGILLVVYGITEFAQSSGAIAGLTFGIVLGNARKILSLDQTTNDTLTNSAKLFFSQISFFVKTFFFVYIGILLDFTNIWALFLAASITVAVFLVRPISVRLAYKEPAEKNADRQIMESMVPKGLAAAVLAQVPLQYGLVGAENFLTPVIATILFTIILTTIFVFMAGKGYYKGTSYLIAHFLEHNTTSPNNAEKMPKNPKNKG